MNLVVGATGLLGGAICRELARQGMPVRAVTRTTSDPARVRELRDLGADLVEADLRDTRSLVGACRGVDTVLSTVTTTVSRQPGDTIQTVDLDGQCSLIDAARANGVRHFVYISYPDMDRDQPCPLTIAKRTVERHLQASGLTHTILRANTFMEVWLSPALGFDYANARAQIYGSGAGKVSWVSVADVARFAVASLDAPLAQNAIWDVAGPEALSPLEVVRVFEDVGRREFEVSHVPLEALRAQRAAATDPLEQSFAALALALADGFPVDMRGLLETVPLRLTSVRAYAEAVLAQQPVER